MLSFRSLVTPFALVLGLVALPIGAQERRDEPIPKSAMPPAGMCRVWLDNVAAAQQPAPTDCSTAIKNSPGSGARLIFGTLSRAARIRPLEPVQPGILNRQSSEQVERAYLKRPEQGALRTEQPVQRTEANDRRQIHAQAAAASARATATPPPPIVRPQPVAQPTPPPVKPQEKPQY